MPFTPAQRCITLVATSTDISEKWGAVFHYPDQTDARHTDNKRRRERADADKENSSGPKAARRRRYERRGIRDAIDPHDAVTMYRFLAMEPENVRTYPEGCEEMAAAGERNGLEEKADSWRESLAPPGPTTSDAD